MFIKKLCFLLLGLILTACVDGQQDNGADWGEYDETVYEINATPEQLGGGFEYTEVPISEPYYTEEPVTDTLTPVDIIAVLLPLTGQTAALGQQIKHAIEIAFLQRQVNDILVSFHDLEGSRENKIRIIESVLARKPDIIIGPVFTEDAKLVRDIKPDELPVISFTSDNASLGHGVLSVGLMPNQSVETIVKQMASKGKKRVLFLAPDNQSGYTNSVSAIESARMFGLDIKGLYYYRTGDTDSIKETAQRATLYTARMAANKRAKETISNLLIKEQLTPSEKSSLSGQLSALNKKDTIGELPYDAILFLGDAPDSKALASFLRYYDLNQKQISFFGTALWDSKILFNDVTLAGSEYSSLPANIAGFNRIYQDIEGVEPERIASMGYDAAMLSINALLSKRELPQYLLNPSGYRGLDGLFRLRTNGTNERALEVMELTGAGAPKLKVAAVKNFMSPIYATQMSRMTKPAEFGLSSSLNLDDYVTIPERYNQKYRLGTFGEKKNPSMTEYTTISKPIMILPEDDSEVFNTPEFQPYSIQPIKKTNIDSVEVRE